MNRQRLVHRISRLQGQLEALKKLLEKEESCEQVLLQAKTCRSAMESFSKAVFSNMLLECATAGKRLSEKEMLDKLEIAIKNL